MGVFREAKRVVGARQRGLEVTQDGIDGQEVRALG